MYNVLKSLLGFLSIIVASEYVSRALTTALNSSPAMYYGEALSIFILGAVTLREGARSLMALRVMEVAEPRPHLVG